LALPDKARIFSQLKPMVGTCNKMTTVLVMTLFLRDSKKRNETNRVDVLIELEPVESSRLSSAV
jgi:hypothetical protein